MGGWEWTAQTCPRPLGCLHTPWMQLPGPEGPSWVSMKSGASPALFCVKGPLQPFFPVSLLTVEVTVIKSNELQLFPRKSGQQTALLLPPPILQPPVRDRPPGPAHVDPARLLHMCFQSRSRAVYLKIRMLFPHRALFLNCFFIH